MAFTWTIDGLTHFSSDLCIPEMVDFESSPPTSAFSISLVCLNLFFCIPGLLTPVANKSVQSHVKSVFLQFHHGQVPGYDATYSVPHIIENEAVVIMNCHVGLNTIFTTSLWTSSLPNPNAFYFAYIGTVLKPQCTKSV
jgi:hypothetical protein